jgi:dihydroorotase
MKLLLKNCYIVDPVMNYGKNNQILIENGFIKEISKSIDVEADLVLDLIGTAVMPGLIDMHCHLREPGYEYKETVKTGTKAAAKGGFTTICCMPNTNPVIDNIDSLNVLKRVIEKDSVINVIPIGAVTKGQKGIELVNMGELAEHGVWLFSDDGRPLWNDEIIKSCLSMAKENNYMIIDHCEDLDLVSGGIINEGESSKKLGLKGISNASEALPVIRNIKFAEKLNASVHIAHISTAESLKAIKEAKEKGIKVTCEVMPHHISLCDDDITEDNTDFKVNPPLRSIKDVEALRTGLVEGVIDVIATDHAPHGEKDKPIDFYNAAFGISGIETAFSVCYTYLVRTELLSIKDLTKLMCQKPADLLNINGGRICKGCSADLAVFDLNANYIVDKREFISKGKNTPYHGKRLWGETIMTIYKGKIVYRKDESDVYR